MEEIARAFLVSRRGDRPAHRPRETNALGGQGSLFEIPRGDERAKRLPSVLEVVYAIFNEGYSATAWRERLGAAAALRGGDAARPHPVRACSPRLRGPRPPRPAWRSRFSRLKARTGPGGEPILLLDQDRSRWDQLLIRRGLSGFAKRCARQLGSSARAVSRCRPGRDRRLPCTSRRWRRKRIGRSSRRSTLRSRMSPSSPVVELNRAVALGKAVGPAAGLELADALMQEAALADRHLLHRRAVRGDLLKKLGRRDEARAEFERAASLTRNERERALMLGRANAIALAPSPR